MKVTFKAGEMAKGLKYILKAISPRNGLPVLSHVYLKSERGMLSLVGGDTVTEVKCFVSAESQDSIELTLPAKKLSDMCLSWPLDSTVTIEQKDGDIFLRCGRSKIKLETFPVDSYPFMDVAKLNPLAVVDANDFIASVDSIRHAAADMNHIKAYLACIRLVAKGNDIYLYAATGEVVARNIIRGCGENLDIEVSISIDGIVAILDACKNDSKVAISISDNCVMFDAGSHSCAVRLMTTEYPNIEKAIGGVKDSDCIDITTKKIDLVAAINRALIFSDEKYPTLHIESDGGGIKITGSGVNASGFVDIVDGDAGSFDPAGYLIAYFKDFLSVSGDDVEFKIAVSGGRAAIIEIGDYCGIMMSRL